MAMDASTKLRIESEAEAWKHMLSFANSMALKCVVELKIPDILHSHNRPLSLSDIASNIVNNSSSSSSSINISFLSRIMRLLVHNNIFTSTAGIFDADDNSPDVLYGLTLVSRWFVGSELNPSSLAPALILQNHLWQHKPWHHLGACIREGGNNNPFEMAHGLNIWDFAAKNPEFNNLYKFGLKCSGEMTSNAIIGSIEKETWDSLETLVDVAGGTGKNIAEIVKAYPHIKGINFDLPHVISIAPEHAGVTHVGGNMFDEVPSAQAVIMKWILHDWDDEKCVKLLKNCRKAMPDKTGRLFVVDMVLNADDDEAFTSVGLAFDLLMMAHYCGGKERTESEFKNLLQKGGFRLCKFTKITAVYSMIEAYPI